jgi:hypothetical protein
LAGVTNASQSGHGASVLKILTGPGILR